MRKGNLLIAKILKYQKNQNVFLSNVKIEMNGTHGIQKDNWLSEKLINACNCFDCNLMCTFKCIEAKLIILKIEKCIIEN